MARALPSTDPPSLVYSQPSSIPKTSCRLAPCPSPLPIPAPHLCPVCLSSAFLTASLLGASQSSLQFSSCDFHLGSELRLPEGRDQSVSSWLLNNAQLWGPGGGWEGSHCMAGGEQGAGQMERGGRTERWREQLRSEWGRAGAGFAPRLTVGFTPGLGWPLGPWKERLLGEWMLWFCSAPPAPAQMDLPFLRWVELGLSVGRGTPSLGLVYGKWEPGWGEGSGEAEKQKEQKREEG